jgi:hypothetical protein
MPKWQGKVSCFHMSLGKKILKLKPKPHWVERLKNAGKHGKKVQKRTAMIQYLTNQGQGGGRLIPTKDEELIDNVKKKSRLFTCSFWMFFLFQMTPTLISMLPTVQ